MRSTLLVLLSTALLAACGDATEPEPQPEPEPEQQADDDLPQSKADAADLTNQGKADWTLDICEAREWYGDGECDWYCPRRDEDCNADPLGPDPQGEPTKYPIVLAHGFMGSPTNFWAFNNVETELEKDGHVVYSGEVPPFHSPAVRGERLAEQIDQVLEETGADKVNIIAHSMGGVDSRYLISTLGYGDRVASLTTISSPHRGTKVADIGLGITPGAFDDAIDALLVAIGEEFSNEAEEASFREALEGIAVKNMSDFNEENPDDPDVYYQSWAGISAVTGFANGDAAEHCEDQMMLHEGTYDHMSGLLWAIVPFVAGLSVAPNDGMATVESAKWGEFQGCIPADHLDEVGQLSGEPDLDTGFDHIRFYRNIAYGLAEGGL